MTNSNIPKKIHYCWFGRGQKSENFQRYLDSRKKYCPDYEICEWNESNFDVYAHTYTRSMYTNKKRAFLVDYVRFWILYHEGGIYLDSDVEIVKNMDALLTHQCFLGFQDTYRVNGAIMGAQAGHIFLKEVLAYYETKKRPIILPSLLSGLLRKKGLQRNRHQTIQGVTVYPKEYFYPFAFFEKFNPCCVTPDTYTIHRFEGTWLSKFVVNLWFPLVGLYFKITDIYYSYHGSIPHEK